MERIVPPLTDEQRVALVSAAREMLTAAPGGKAVKFRHQGRTLNGFDCVGMAVLCFQKLGIEVDDRIDYGRLPNRNRLEEVLIAHFGDPVQVRPRLVYEDLLPGDLVSMTWGDEDNHVGLVGDYPIAGHVSIIHCYARKGRVVEHRLDPVYFALVTSVYRP